MDIINFITNNWELIAFGLSIAIPQSGAILGTHQAIRKRKMVYGAIKIAQGNWGKAVSASDFISK